MKKLPLYLRPREKLKEVGAGNVTNEELIALILRTGTKKRPILQTAKNILKTTNLSELAHMSVDELQTVAGIGSAYASSLLAAIELANRVRDEEGVALIKPEHIVQHVMYIAHRRKEYFICLFVNARFNLIAKKVITIGTIDASLAHPREIFRPAIELGASHIIIAHNHPSGDPEPSNADILLTARIVEVGEIIGINVLDHIVVARNGWVSFKKREML